VVPVNGSIAPQQRTWRNRRGRDGFDVRNKELQIVAASGIKDYLGPMATDVEAHRSTPRVSPTARAVEAVRAVMPGWPAPAWGAIGVTALFIGITCWWLSRDRSIPIWDAGLHLAYAIYVYRDFGAGNLVGGLTMTAPYPPFAYVVGSLGFLIGGIGVAPPILAENALFVSLLALGCYQVGRLAFGRLAGLLAVVFALGTPLIIAQFHVFMTDAPETAMVAVSIWLIIATRGFSRLGMSAIAGVAVGLGMLTKEPFAFFVVGIVAVTAVRGAVQAWYGDWRAWRGMAIFAGLALAIALPWYIHEYSAIKAIKGEATAQSGVFNSLGSATPTGIAPPRLSLENLEWYLWNFINWQLYLPLFLFAAVGWVWTLVGLVRRRPISPLTPELLVGAFCGWLTVTMTYVHDVRYGMPLLLYLAVFGVGWITQLRGPWRTVAIVVLAALALTNTLTIDTGIGGPHRIALAGSSFTKLERPGYITIASNEGFPVGAPERDGDLLAMLQALRHEGVRDVTWPPAEALGPNFSNIGVTVLSQIANLTVLENVRTFSNFTARYAVLAYGPEVEPHEKVPPCIQLTGGGVWMRLGNPTAPGTQDYCPFPKPHYYGPKQP
jgi:hypothetical protein